MKRFQLKKYGKYLAGLIAAGALISLAIFPALGMKADAPRFNFLDGDKELIAAKKVGDTSPLWYDPLTIHEGESFIGRVYYHNGIVDSVAENTRINVTLPSELRAGNTTFVSSISADNAETVTDTIIDNIVNGRSGMTLTTTEDLALEYVPGSVKWFPNARQTGAAEAPLLYGQTGAELFSAGGLKIGDINGCWDYAGWVTFVARAKKISVPDLQIEKTVKNVTTGTGYVESVEANMTDKLNFKIDVKNSGNVELASVKAYDQLPTALGAIDGTGLLTLHGEVTTPFALSDLLGANGVNIGTLQPNDTATLTFGAKPLGQVVIMQTVNNKAIAASGAMQREDFASVVLKPGNYQIVRSKSAWNVTQNKNAESVLAQAGDVIEYTLTTKNTGDIDTSYIVRDDLDDVMDYASLTDGNGGVLNDNNVIVYPTLNIAAGGEVVKTFKVTVKNPLPSDTANGKHFDLKMENNYGNDVVINIYKEVLKPSLSISKYVRNVTANEQNFVEANTAYAGEMLEYKIVFKNSGNGPADYIKISDVLPANVTLDSTSAAILYYEGEEKSIAENIQSGYTLKTLAAGDEAYIRFRAVISSGVAEGEVLTNTAYLRDDSTLISDTAQTVVKVKTVLTKAPTPSLPRTGASDTLVISLIVAMVSTGSLALARQSLKR